MAKPRLITKIINVFTRHFLYRVKHINEEVLDRYNSYVIAPSHSCVFDPAFVFPMKYDRDISIVAKKEMFKYAWFRFLAKKYGVFPVDRENVDVRSMMASINTFKYSKENDIAGNDFNPECSNRSAEKPGCDLLRRCHFGSTNYDCVCILQ